MSASRAGRDPDGVPSGDDLALALEAGGLGVWRWDCETDAVTWSQSVNTASSAIA